MRECMTFIFFHLTRMGNSELKECTLTTIFLLWWCPTITLLLTCLCQAHSVYSFVCFCDKLQVSNVLYLLSCATINWIREDRLNNIGCSNRREFSTHFLKNHICGLFQKPKSKPECVRLTGRNGPKSTLIWSQSSFSMLSTIQVNLKKVSLNSPKKQ